MNTSWLDLLLFLSLSSALDLHLLLNPPLLLLQLLSQTLLLSLLLPQFSGCSFSLKLLEQLLRPFKVELLSQCKYS